MSSPQRPSHADRHGHDALRCTMTGVSATTADDAIAKSRLLEGLDRVDCRAIVAEAKERRYPAGEIIYAQGTQATELFLLTDGRARYFFTTQQGQKLILMWLTPGEVFGVRTLLSLRTSNAASLETLKESHVLVWDRSTIRRLAKRFPRILENSLSIAKDYLDWYIAAHVAVSCHSGRLRLAEVLVCLSRVNGHEVPGGIEIDATNEELGGAANITPFSVSRLLSEWQRNKALVKRRGKVVLRAPERLFASVS